MPQLALTDSGIAMHEVPAQKRKLRFTEEEDADIEDTSVSRVRLAVRFAT
jgi:hypothetical protein